MSDPNMLQDSGNPESAKEQVEEYQIIPAPPAGPKENASATEEPPSQA